MLVAIFAGYRGATNLMSSINNYICIHGHFYQPPRENPWLETIEEQPSAAPYHDWNERITAECYRPNVAARILDKRGYIKSIVNNYASMSFNFGPTLLSWMEVNAPETYEGILEADAQSMLRFDGHGSAMAQIYNHVIMPLANMRDKRTQVRWGIADFRLRFGRMPEGMWLSECAVDSATLEILAEEGIKFTVLSPFQAKRVRPLGADNMPWQDALGGSIDSSMPYLVKLPSGKSIAVFFYDHIVSQAVAFEGLLNDGDRFAQKLLGRIDDSIPNGRPYLINIATDGESYGHHHKFGEMALAYALDYVENSNQAKLTNYAEFLEIFPPSFEVELIEPSSWSCAHGVERWHSNCGCRLNNTPGWTQEWRTPLREALNWLRDATAPLYEYASRELMSSPWEARDSYIHVLNDIVAADNFLRRYTPSVSMESEQIRVLRLMEIQRHAQLMFTSCGWFFDDISGIETVQILRYASRVIDLVKKVFSIDLEPEFLERLAEAQSNIESEGDGASVYMKHVKDAQFSFTGVVAQRCIMELFSPGFSDRDVRAFNVDLVDVTRRESLMIGRAILHSKVTRGYGECEYVLLGEANFDVICAVREKSEGGVQELLDTFKDLPIEQIPATIRQYFPESCIYTLQSLRPEAQGKVLDMLASKSQEHLRTVLRDEFEKNKPLLYKLRDYQLPLQKHLKLLADCFVNDMLRAEITTPGTIDEKELDMLATWIESGKIYLNENELLFLLRSRLIEVADKWAESPRDEQLLDEFTKLASLADFLPAKPDCTHAQNVFWRLKQQVYVRMNENQKTKMKRLGNLLKVYVEA